MAKAQKKSGAAARGATAVKRAARRVTGGKKAASRGTSASAAAEKASGKKTTSKKTATKSAPAKKTAARKTAAKKTATKKTAAKKTAAKKTAAKKAAAKKTPAKKTAAKKTAAKKTAAKKTAAKKTPAKKTSAEKTTKKPAGKKASAKRPPAAKGMTNARLARSLAVLDNESPWTAAELGEVRSELEADRDRLTTEIERSESDLQALLRDGVDGAGNDQADVGSNSLERDAEMSLAQSQREQLRQIEHALDRIHDGTYGSCESCGNPIGKMRLMAFPRATLCMTCKQREERR